MKLPLQTKRGRSTHLSVIKLDKRQMAMTQGTKFVIIFGVIIAFFLCGALILAFVLRFLRARHANPKYLPGRWLKSRWRAWVPSGEKKRYSSSLQGGRSLGAPSAAGLPGSAASDNAGSASSRGSRIPDRNTSVRSTITLPAYSSAARPTEQILGREGERAGIDTVIEFPETIDEEEHRRDEEMEGLYQIRRTRRDERAEREEQRQQRRDARARNDQTTLAALRRAQLAMGNPASGALIEAHQNRERGGKISSVNYLQLGVARHDGSRLRAQSNDSNRSLLGGAANMGSDDTSAGLETNFGNVSSSSLRFMSADYSDDEAVSDVEGNATPGRARTPSRPRLRGDQTEITLDQLPPHYDEVTLQSTVSNHPQQPPTIATTQPLGEPPSYSSPVQDSAPQLPAIANVPSIDITPTPLSPIVPH